MLRFLHLVAALAVLTAGPVFAGDFDGSKPLICAPVEAIGCVAGEACTKGRPAAIGAPNFLRIDFAQKAIVGPKLTTPIQFMDKSDGQILLQGKELGYGWTLVLDQDSGTMTATLANREEVFALFGSCTPYNLGPCQCRAQHAGCCAVEVEGSKLPSSAWLLNLQILTCGGLR